MRYVVYTDERGWKRRSLVRDTDSDEMAPKGIPAGPPDLDTVDWNAIKKEINNAMVDQGLFTWNDLQGSSVGLQVVTLPIRRALSSMFREQDKQRKVT